MGRERGVRGFCWTPFSGGGDPNSAIWEMFRVMILCGLGEPPADAAATNACDNLFEITGGTATDPGTHAMPTPSEAFRANA